MYNLLMPFKGGGEIFSILIKKEFLWDLEAAAIICSTPEEERDDGKRLLLGILMQKYSLPEFSPLCKYAPKDLRQKFDRMHEEIRSVIYGY